LLGEGVGEAQVQERELFTQIGEVASLHRLVMSEPRLNEYIPFATGHGEGDGIGVVFPDRVSGFQPPLSDSLPHLLQQNVSTPSTSTDPPANPGESAVP